MLGGLGGLGKRQLGGLLGGDESSAPATGTASAAPATGTASAAAATSSAPAGMLGGLGGLMKRQDAGALLGGEEEDDSTIPKEPKEPLDPTESDDEETSPAAEEGEQAPAQGEEAPASDDSDSSATSGLPLKRQDIGSLLGGDSKGDGKIPKEPKEPVDPTEDGDEEAAPAQGQEAPASDDSASSGLPIRRQLGLGSSALLGGK